MNFKHKARTKSDSKNVQLETCWGAPNPQPFACQAAFRVLPNKPQLAEMNLRTMLATGFRSRCSKINPVIKSAAGAASRMTKMQGSPALLTGLIFKHLKQSLAVHGPQRWTQRQLSICVVSA